MQANQFIIEVGKQVGETFTSYGFVPKNIKLGWTNDSTKVRRFSKAQAEKQVADFSSMINENTQFVAFIRNF